jgi:hypothetical protein
MPITTLSSVLQNQGKGKGLRQKVLSLGPVATTAAAAASNFIPLQIIANSLGTTHPATLVGFPLPTGITNEMFVTHLTSVLGINQGRAYWLALFYKIGTLNLAATGDQFTHDAATFPILRTQYGVASQPIDLLPFLQVTTATTVTAPIIRMRTNAGVSGYKNQSGSNIVGTKTITFPAAATGASSGFYMQVENGDSAVQDVTAIEVTTAASAGAATLWGVELLVPLLCYSLNGMNTIDTSVFAAAMNDMMPGLATSGTATSFLGFISTQLASATGGSESYINGVLNV